MYTLKLIEIHCSTGSYPYHNTPLLLYRCPYNCLYIKLSNWKWITIIILNDNWTVAWNGSPGLMPPEQLNAVHWSGLSQNLSELQLVAEVRYLIIASELFQVLMSASTESGACVQQYVPLALKKCSSPHTIARFVFLYWHSVGLNRDHIWSEFT